MLEADLYSLFLFLNGPSRHLRYPLARLFSDIYTNMYYKKL